MYNFQWPRGIELLRFVASVNFLWLIAGLASLITLIILVGSGLHYYGFVDFWSYLGNT